MENTAVVKEMVVSELNKFLDNVKDKIIPHYQDQQCIQMCIQLKSLDNIFQINCQLFPMEDKDDFVLMMGCSFVNPDVEFHGATIRGTPIGNYSENSFVIESPATETDLFNSVYNVLSNNVPDVISQILC